MTALDDGKEQEKRQELEESLNSVISNLQDSEQKMCKTFSENFADYLSTLSVYLHLHHPLSQRHR